MAQPHHGHPIDVAIIGAGAAGLAAGIFAGEAAAGAEHSIVIFDSANSIGAKILVSGGGRCNVTHEAVTPVDFFGNRHIIKNVLAAFSVRDTIAWFDSLGVKLKREDTGKLFPASDKARTVLTALIGRCRELHVPVLTDHRVMAVEPDADHAFTIRHAQGAVRARTVILATGGRSLPKTGSDGFGYGLARKLGHTVTPTAPALVPLDLSPAMFHAMLSGLSQRVELTNVLGGKALDRRTGSLLWTHIGISGPVVMDASRFWTLARDRGDAVALVANFLPGRTEDGARAWFREQATIHPRRSLGKTLGALVPERFAEALCRYLEIDAGTSAGQVMRHDRDRLCEALTRFQVPVERDRGWNHAEVTAGGVPLEEINFRTMASKLVPGLYLIGEILDCDGRIGGFNFQWAWATGRLAGRAAVASLRTAQPSVDPSGAEVTR